jgi:hypothetical protein
VAFLWDIKADYFLQTALQEEKKREGGREAEREGGREERRKEGRKESYGREGES